MVHPQRTCSHMELLPLVCLCLLSCSGTTSADPAGTVVVEKGSDVILPCSNNGVNLETESFDWTKGQMKVFSYAVGQHSNKGKPGQAEQFRGRVSHFEEELKHGNASIKITNATMADSGDYTCEFPGVYPPRKSHVKLVVGAPKPSVTILHETENSAVLQCEAHGVPDLEVHWQDSDGNKLPAEEPQVTERGGLSYITLKTNVTKTGNFFCVATQKNLGHEISAEIFVRLPRRVVVEEGRDVILPCFFHGVDVDKERLEWQKNGHTVLEYDANVLKKLPDDRFSRVQDKLKLGNASIKIRNTKVEDRGDYTCHILDSSHEIVHVKLVVGAAPEPFITILHQTDDWARLQCKAHGVPDLEVHWQDSDGNKLPAEEPQVLGSEHKYITLNTTVTKTGHFSCIATQKNISHRISSQIYVHVHDNTGWIVAAILGTLLVAAVGVVIYMCKQKHKRGYQGPGTA